MKRRFAGVCAVFALVAAWSLPAWAQPVVWLELEDYAEASGTVQLVDSATGDYGAMARAEASGERFLRLGPGDRKSVV